MTAYVFKRKRPPVLQYTGYYTKVGSPTITDNVVSGFSASNYLKLPQTFNPSSKAWEWCFKLTMGSDVSITAYILGCTDTSGSHGAMFGMVYGKFTCWLSANGTSWNIVTDGTTTTSLVAGETYYVKFGWTGSEYYIDISTNGIDYVREYTLASTSAVHSSVFNIGSAWHLRNPFNGSIDLTESYIKVDGEYWWRGAYYANADKCYVLKRKRPAEYRKTVIDTATAGTYTFDVAKDTTARIILVGGGGGGGPVWSGVGEGSGGGSGACIYCQAKLKAGTYTITNGAGGAANTGSGGNSTLFFSGTTLLTAGGGSVGTSGGSGKNASGGTYNISSDIEILKTFIVANGNVGTYGGSAVGKGGASVYGGYGEGEHTDGDSVAGTSGYIFVELTTDETDYDYKIDNDACYVLKRKQYWKYEYKDWEQPVLTANGTIGRDSFAVYTPNTIDDNSVLYNMFNENAGNVSFYDELPISIVFYNPNKLKVKSISLGQYTTTYWVKGVFQGCDDNASWVDIKDIDFGGTPITFDVNSEVAYKYHRFHITSSYSNGTILNSIKITAQEQITVKATKDDYDFITD